MEGISQLPGVCASTLHVSSSQISVDILVWIGISADVWNALEKLLANLLMEENSYFKINCKLCHSSFLFSPSSWELLNQIVISSLQLIILHTISVLYFWSWINLEVIILRLCYPCPFSEILNMLGNFAILSSWSSVTYRNWRFNH